MYPTSPWADLAPNPFHNNYIHDTYHRREFEQICERKIKEAVPKMVAQLTQQYIDQAIQRLVGIIQYDINTYVKLGLQNAGDVFYGEKTSKFISDHIANEL